MRITEDSFASHIPYYLTAERKEGLLQELRSFPATMNYFISKYCSDVLQGDCWTNLPIFNYYTGEKKYIHGMILSNSCDISPENDRKSPPNISFTPIITLDALMNVYRNSGESEATILKVAESVRRQELTNIFYIPSNQDIGVECVALLDQIHTVPLKAFLDIPSRVKKFTLSDSGFYLFLFKLSVHFCRFHENVDRSSS